MTSSPSGSPATSSPTASGWRTAECSCPGVQAVARLPIDQLRIDRRDGLEHRRLRVRLSGLAGRHAAGGAQPGGADRARPARRRAPRRQRGARRHGRDGQPARRLTPGADVRRRARHLVRQGARPRPGQRRHPPRRLRRHRPPRRRGRRRRRRPRREVVDAAQLERRHDGRPAHADHLPRRRAGGARPRPPLRRPVAGERRVGRLQARHRGRRRHRHRRRPPRSRRAGDPDDGVRR